MAKKIETEKLGTVTWNDNVVGKILTNTAVTKTTLLNGKHEFEWILRFIFEWLNGKQKGLTEEIEFNLIDKKCHWNGETSEIVEALCSHNRSSAACSLRYRIKWTIPGGNGSYVFEGGGPHAPAPSAGSGKLPAKKPDTGHQSGQAAEPAPAGPRR